MFPRNSLFWSASIALFAMVAVPSSAGAEKLSLSFNKETDGVISHEECRLKKTKSVRFDCGGSIGEKLVIYASPSGVCTNTPGTDAILLLPERTISSASDCSGTLSVNTADVVGENCECNVTKSFQLCAATKYQAYNYETLITEWQEGETVSLAINYDTKSPTTPILESVDPGDSSLHLKFSGAEDVYEWVVCVEAIGESQSDSSIAQGDHNDQSDQTVPPEENDKTDGASESLATAAFLSSAEDSSHKADNSNASSTDDAETADSSAVASENEKNDDGNGTDGFKDSEDKPDETATESDNAVCESGNNPFQDRDCFKLFTLKKSASATKGQAKGLENGVTYRVTIAAKDTAGNYSGVSESKEATPVAVRDFFSAYKEAGGTESGGFGCSASGGISGGLAALSLALFFPLTRRRIRRKGVFSAANDPLNDSVAGSGANAFDGSSELSNADVREGRK